MEKAYSPEQFESRLYEWWEKSGWFSADEPGNQLDNQPGNQPGNRSTRPSFMMAMPPPNITGVLHNGHALFVTIQDAITRWKRMCGYNVLWLPGTDHAGIATQMVVERELSRQGIKHRELGREKFLEKVWEWKEKHGRIITTQLKKLGASPDWKRERFTMDEGLSHAVREVFVSLYEEGLIYRGTRMINWSVGLQTAVSDLEAVPLEKKGNLWHIRYHVAQSDDQSDDRSDESLVIATTRPETLLGDTAVAVHPDDDRYKKLIGKKVKLPFVGREIPIIADAYVEKDFGTGALKVTPAHDFNDYEIGRRHQLQVINVFNKNGTINKNGHKFAGMKLSEARRQIIEELTAMGDLVQVEEITHTVSLCQRTETVLEPTISDQWFVAVSKTPKSGGRSLAGAAIDAVKIGENLPLAEVDKREDAIKIVPQTWNTTYYHWMENIRDWCISRQLWWGHQIPAWHCGDCRHITVLRITAIKCEKCGSTKLTQDDDVLDTWFSSALWPFSTLGWPQKTQALEKFYPGSVMETGFDILFFWVARMIMMGMHFNSGKVPFKRVYLHAMVRDEKGQKMSKTKGNVIDPLDIIRDYGADAFRFTLAAMAGQGRDVKLSFERIQGYKAFCNKLWNASRFALIKFEKTDFAAITDGKTLEEYVFLNRKNFHPINQYILQQLNQVIVKVNDGFENFKLNEAANEAYTFIWNEFCDWYIEFSKVLLAESESARPAEQHRNETKVCLLYVLESAMKLIHPLIPFITEEIYQHLPERPGVKKGEPIMLAVFPGSDLLKEDKTRQDKNGSDETAIQKVIFWKTAIDAIRAFRGENGISPKLKLRLTMESPDKTTDKKTDQTTARKAPASIQEGLPFILALANLESIVMENGSNKGKNTTAEVLVGAVKFFIPMEGLVDFTAELARVVKEMVQVKRDIEFVGAKLAKESFIEKAPQTLIEKEKEKLSEYQAKYKELERSHDKLRALIDNIL